MGNLIYVFGTIELKRSPPPSQPTQTSELIHVEADIIINNNQIQNINKICQQKCHLWRKGLLATVDVSVLNK